MQERIRLAEWDNDNDPSMVKKIKEMNTLGWLVLLIKINKIIAYHQWKNQSTISYLETINQNQKALFISQNILLTSLPQDLLFVIRQHQSQE